jgi:23S rRNA (cytosine1962-C5)-methyltransferase
MHTPIQTPLDDYELIDFGNGRKLERFGQYLVDRPAPQAIDKPALSSWDPDWVYTGDRVATGQWQARHNDLPDEWKINVDGQRMFIQLSDGGQVGLYPEHIACWRWVRERLEGCDDIEDIKALNLFAATGGATLSAVNVGATVTHVDASKAAINQARENVGNQGARWMHEDVNTYVERAIRRRETFDLIIADPPSFGRGPKGKSWDIEVDLARLTQSLAHLISPNCRGVWLSFHTTEWSSQTVEEMLVENLPKRNIKHLKLGVATQDGRILKSGDAVCWELVGF